VRTAPWLALPVAFALFHAAPAAGEDVRRARDILVEGRTLVRLHEPDGDPPVGFEPAEATLEDAYLVLMRSGHSEGEEGKHGGAAAAAAVRPIGPGVATTTSPNRSSSELASASARARDDGTGTTLAPAA